MKKAIHITRRLPCLLAALLLTQCTSSDPEFARLQSSVQRDVDSDAILGMWHRKADNLGNAAVDIDQRHSLLFGRGGAGHLTGSTIVDGTAEKYTETFSWNYQGHGEWVMSHARYKGTIRLSAGKLLLTMTGSGFTQNWIYSRVQ